MVDAALQVARSLPDLPLPGREVRSQQMADWLRARLRNHRDPKPMAADSLFSALKKPTSQAPLFLAILEMTKAGEIGLDQVAHGEPLYLLTTHPEDLERTNPGKSDFSA